MKLPQTFVKKSNHIHAVIETPKGCAAKYNFDPETGSFKLKKILPEGMVFPFHFGFISLTMAEDGDPVDVFVLMDEPSWPGCVIECKVLGVIEAEQTKRRWKNRKEKLNRPTIGVNKIAIPTMEGLQMVLTENIISCESDRNYTILFLKNKQKMIASRTLKDIEEMLEDYSFARVHHSYLVNLNEVEKYIRGEGGYLIMSDKTTVDVSRSRKEMLLKKLQPSKL